MLAVAVADGSVHLFEFKDLTNLSSWTKIGEFKTGGGACNCIDWNPAFDEIPMLVVGSSEIN